MEIKDMRKIEKKKTFNDLTEGDIFGYGRDIFMKIEEINDPEYSTFNAVSLVNGDLEYFCAGNEVTPLVVQLHIIRNG